jgi:hypothetical protein
MACDSRQSSALRFKLVGSSYFKTLLILVTHPRSFTQLFYYAGGCEGGHGCCHDVRCVVEVRLVASSFVKVREATKKMLENFVNW